MTDPDLWAVLERAAVIEYLAENPNAEQLELFGEGQNLFIDGITKSGSTMKIGMFGQADYYFFFMKFKPTTSYVLDTETFECWF